MHKQINILSQREPQSTSELLEILLTNRSIDLTTSERFFHPQLSDVSVEAVGINENEVKKAQKRLKAAIDKNEQIVVFGDYDVDGITGSSILWESLYDLGATVTPYIPDRIDEGYGLSVKGITKLLSEVKETKLIITVDNGIVAHDAVSFAKEKGIDVIITDHHVGGKEPPDSYALIHTTKLCGAGVAWVFSKSFRTFLKKENDELDRSHLELATLGTIADLVPLQDANRTIVYYGLKALQRTKRPGLIALCTEAGITPDSIGVYEIGFMLAPRLNASGRIGSAMDSLRLVCTKDQKRANELAESLGLTNKERQRIMFEAAEHASNEVRGRDSLSKLLIVSHESYQEGVIGLVAGKLVEEYYRPAIVISKGEVLSKGSVRSVSGFDIISFLRTSEHLFVNVGGHPMAAGFTIETGKLDEFKKTLEELATEAIVDELLQKKLTVDCYLPFSLISPEVYKTINTLAPFGMKNAQPVFMTKGITVRDKRFLGKEGKHLRLVVQDEMSGKLFEAIGFNLADKGLGLQVDDMITLIYTLDENTWNGTTKLQLKIKDFYL